MTLSSDILAFIAQRASALHHGQIIVDINADSPSKIDVTVIEKERFRTSEGLPTTGEQKKVRQAHHG